MSNEQKYLLFNGPIETGLRSLVLLSEAYPTLYSLQRLVIFDYLSVHSDDIPNGPKSLHPKTPNRSGELLVRRNTLREGLLLYQSRGLLERRFEPNGIYFVATDKSGWFLDSFNTNYVRELRKMAGWVIGEFGERSDNELLTFVNEHIGTWSTEFEWSPSSWTKENV